MVVLTVLQGGRFFAEKLLAGLRAGVATEQHEVKASSYSGDGQRVSEVRLDRSLQHLKGRTVLVVDDILDTGKTIAALRDKLADVGVREIKVAVLIDKRHSSIVKHSTVDFCALVHHGDEWLGGAGMEMVGVPDEIARRAPFLIAHPPLAHE